MTRRSLLSLAALIALLLATAGALAAEPAPSGADLPRMVILVRHAEKAAEPANDPPLTAAGEERARALALALKDAGVTAIVTSDTRRTRATTEPLARDRHLTPTLFAVAVPTADHVAAVTGEIRRHAGEVVLVVGHSDTIPLIIAALGGPRVPEIPHGEFARLYVLTPGADGAARLVQATYGAPDPR